jgi:hypothetical protein
MPQSDPQTHSPKPDDSQWYSPFACRSDYHQEDGERMIHKSQGTTYLLGDSCLDFPIYHCDIRSTAKAMLPRDGLCAVVGTGFLCGNPGSLVVYLCHTCWFRDTDVTQCLYCILAAFGKLTITFIVISLGVQATYLSCPRFTFRPTLLPITKETDANRNE